MNFLGQVLQRLRARTVNRQTETDARGRQHYHAAFAWSIKYFKNIKPENMSLRHTYLGTHIMLHLYTVEDR